MTDAETSPCMRSIRSQEQLRYNETAHTKIQPAVLDQKSPISHVHHAVLVSMPQALGLIQCSEQKKISEQT